MKTYTTSCPRNCYSTCSLKVGVSDDGRRIERIEALPANSAVPKGACLKGLSYVERQESEDRILTPLRRDPVEERFYPVSWEEALDRITEKLVSIRDEYGPQSILYYSASGTKGLLNGVGSAFWKMFGGYTTTFGDLCWPAGLEASRLTLGANKQNVPWDIENARLIVLWGKNVAETNVQQMRSIDKAVEAGARLVVIDPRRTLSADRSELLVQPRPGTDGALALALAHVLIKNNQIDQAFIDKHVYGFPEFKELALGFSPEQAQEISDVPVEVIHRLAGLLGSIKPVTLCAGFGMQRYTNSGQAMRAMIALMAITGNIGKPGACWQFADLQTDIFGSVKDPFAYYPPEIQEGPARITISTARLGEDMLAQTEPALKMAWVERGNPVTQNPDTRTVLKAFRALEFRVVVEQFMTDTAREADIILPAKTLFEQTDVIGAYWHPYIQIKQKILEPPNGVKPETEIYRALAARLGFPQEEVDEHIPGPGDEDIEVFLERKMAPFPELTLEKLRQGPVLAPGTRDVAFDDLIFNTPSGKIELLSQEAQTRWGVEPLPEYSEPMESVRRLSREADRYPLYMMTPNTKNRIHSQFNNLKVIRQFSPKPVVTMNPEDAVHRKIAHGDRVRIYNYRGFLEVDAELDFSMKKGCVAVTNGWWISQGGTVNYLSRGRETDMGHGAAFHDNLVEVKRV